MSVYETHKPAAGGDGLYLKIEDGQSVKIRLASEPAIFEQESQPDKEGKTRMSTRYGWIVFNQDTKQVQILQQSATFFKQVAGLAQDDEWGDPTNYDIKIRREGTGLETVYNVTPSSNREPLDGDARAAVDATNLIEKLNASPYSQRVMWLSEYDKLAASPANQRDNSDGAAAAATEKREAAKPTPSEDKKDDVVIQDIGDEPINLDDIPFN